MPRQRFQEGLRRGIAFLRQSDARGRDPADRTAGPAECPPCPAVPGRRRARGSACSADTGPSRTPAPGHRRPAAERHHAPSGSTTPSNSTDGIASIDTSTSMGSPFNDSATPSREPTNRGTAPAAVRRSASARSPSRFDAVGDENGHTTRADTAVARTSKQRQGRGFRDLGRHLRLRAPSASAAGICRMPRPAATASASSGATFISPDTMRSRTAGVCTRDSSNRKALMMWVFSTGVWLFQNSVACV